MPVASRSSRLSYVSVKQPAPSEWCCMRTRVSYSPTMTFVPLTAHGPDHQVLSSQPSSPLHGGPNATFTSFNSEGHSRRYHEVKLTGDLSRVSWVWGAPTSLARLSQDKEDSIRIEVISEADAVGEGKMLNPYSEFAPKNNNIVEPELNDGDVANSIRSWTISEEDEASDHEGDSPASFTARFPHTESPRPPESIQDIHNEYQHPNYSHTQFQDRASIASGSTNTLSYVSDDDQPSRFTLAQITQDYNFFSLHKSWIGAQSLSQYPPLSTTRARCRTARTMGWRRRRRRRRRALSPPTSSSRSAIFYGTTADCEVLTSLPF